MEGWNGLDFIIFLIFASNFLLGLSRGASREIISMMSLCAALIVTIKFTVPLAAFFNKSPIMIDVVTSDFIQRFMAGIGAGPLTEDLLKEMFYSISMLLCFVGTFSICEAGLNRTNLMETMSFASMAVSRKIGGALGCTRGYIITLFLLAILSLHVFKPSNRMGDGMIGSSAFAKLFQSQTLQLDKLITGQNPDYYNTILDKNTFGPGEITKILQPKETQVPTKQLQQLQQPNQQQQPAQPQPQPQQQLLPALQQAPAQTLQIPVQ